MAKYIRKIYRCELLTPLIMSGADQSQAELRAPSIKGALRWWWRALHPTGPDAKGEYHELRLKEDNLFGGVHGESAQKSKVSLSVAWETNKSDIQHLTCEEGDGITKWAGPPNKRRPDARDPLTYFLFGAYQMGDNTARTLVLPKSSKNESVYFLLSVRCSADVWLAVEPSIQAMLTFGGFGLKHRNGFGQVAYTVQSETNGQFVEDQINIEEFVEKHRQDSSGDVGYAAFSKQTLLSKHYQSSSSNWKHVLADAGLMYMNAKASLSELTEETENHQAGYQYGEKNLFAAYKPEMWSHPDLPGDHKVARLDKAIQIFVLRSKGEGLQFGFLSLPYTISVSGMRPSAQTINGLRGWKPGVGPYHFDLRPPRKDRTAVIAHFFENLKNPIAE